MRTPGIALLTTLAAFTAYRQQAEGVPLPSETASDPETESAASNLSLNESAAVSDSRGLVNDPESRLQTDTASPVERLKARLGYRSGSETDDSTDQTPLNQQIGQLNGTIEQTRLQRQHQDYLEQLIRTRPVQSMPPSPVLTQTMQSPRTPAANTTAVLPALPPGLPGRSVDAVRSSTGPQEQASLARQQPATAAELLGYSETRSTQIRSTQAQSFPQPEGGSLQPRFSNSAAPSITAELPDTDSRFYSEEAESDEGAAVEATAPDPALSPASRSAIAARLTTADLLRGQSTTPAVAGQYRFREDINIPPLQFEAITISQNCPLPLAESEVNGDDGPEVEAKPVEPDSESNYSESRSSSSAVCLGETSVLAQRMPEAATAGTPIPGSVLSPTR